MLDDILRCVMLILVHKYSFFFFFRETFTVKAKNSPTNVAYTSATLTFHTDLPAYSHMPGVRTLLATSGLLPNLMPVEPIHLLLIESKSFF